MGSNNVLVHLRHHHPMEHARIVDILARRQLEAGGSKQAPAANVVIKSEPENTIDKKIPLLQLQFPTTQGPED